MYDPELNAEGDCNKLALVVYFEKLKGTKSFFHHMLNVE